VSGPVFRRVGETIRQTRKRAREMDGNRFVSSVLCCYAGHAAATVNVYTQLSNRPELTFDEAWTGVWQEAEDWDRTEVNEAPGGHRTVVATCPGCGRSVRIREDRLCALLRAIAQLHTLHRTFEAIAVTKTARACG